MERIHHYNAFSFQFRTSGGHVGVFSKYYLLITSVESVFGSVHKHYSVGTGRTSSIGATNGMSL